MPFRTSPFRLAAVTLAALSLAGCFSLGGKTPQFLITLPADAVPDTGATRTAAAGTALTVAVPGVPQKLRTTRVPVQQDTLAVTYVKDATWVDAPARLFQRLLADTLTARSGRVVLDADQGVTAAGEALSGQLSEFGIDARTNEAVVVYSALVTGAGNSVRQRRFEAREPVAAIDARGAGAALTRAANRVAGEVAAWVG